MATGNIDLHAIERLQKKKKIQSLFARLEQAVLYLHFRLGRGGGLTAGVLELGLVLGLLHRVLLQSGGQGEHALQLTVHQLVLVGVLPLKISSCQYNEQA